MVAEPRYSRSDRRDPRGRLHRLASRSSRGGFEHDQFPPYSCPPGTFILVGTPVLFQPRPNVEIAIAPVAWSRRTPKTKTELLVNKSHPEPGKPRVARGDRDERANGRFGTPYAAVLLRAWARGKWRTLGRTRTSADDRGQVAISARVTKGTRAMRIRAHREG